MEALRREMTENGIEPRQIFGFDPAGAKNAADIELVIDAMDLAYLRPEITTFVLVTRDGGFAALARKLHELGKSVVVCSGANCSGARSMHSACGATTVAWRLPVGMVGSGKSNCSNSV